MSSPRSAAQRCTVGHEHLGAVRVVAEHVQAGAGRAEQHGVAGLGLLEAPARRGLQRVVALQRHARPASACSMRSASRPIVATARAWRDTGARSGAKSWPLPSPPRITTSLRRRLVGAQAVERGDGGADVGALAVVEGVDAVDAWRRARRGAARRRIRAGRAASAPAGSRWRWPAPARPARWRRCGGRARAAHRPASGAGGAALRSASPLTRLMRLVGLQRTHQPGHAVLDRPGRSRRARCGASRPKRTTSRSIGLGVAALRPGTGSGTSFSTAASSRLITITACLPKTRALAAA